MSHDAPGGYRDDLNPYAAPPERGERGVGGVSGGLSRTPFEIGEVFSRAWRIYKPQMGLCIGVVLVGGLIGNVPQLILNGVQKGLQAAQAPPAAVVLISLLGLLLSLVFQLWISAGMSLFLLNVAKGRKAEFNNLFGGGPFLMPFFGAALLTGLVLLAIIALGAIPGGLALALAGGAEARATTVPIAFGIGLFFAFIAAIIVLIRLSPYLYLILDRNAGAMESLQLSLEVTRGNALRLFGLGFLAGLINLLGVLACFVGVLFTAPYTSLAFVVAYLAMTGQPIADPDAPWAPDLPTLKPITPEDPLS